MFNGNRKFAHFFWNLLENGKNAPFHIKSPVKNFHGRAKGGASHRAPPKYATVEPIQFLLQHWPLRSSKVSDFQNLIWKCMPLPILVINSNLGLISQHFRDMASFLLHINGRTDRKNGRQPYHRRDAYSMAVARQKRNINARLVRLCNMHSCSRMRKIYTIRLRALIHERTIA